MRPDLIEVYKIIHGLSAIAFESLVYAQNDDKPKWRQEVNQNGDKRILFNLHLKAT